MLSAKGDLDASVRANIATVEKVLSAAVEASRGVEVRARPAFIGRYLLAVQVGDEPPAVPLSTSVDKTLHADQRAELDTLARVLSKALNARATRSDDAAMLLLKAGKILLGVESMPAARTMSTSTAEPLAAMDCEATAQAQFVAATTIQDAWRSNFTQHSTQGRRRNAQSFRLGSRSGKWNTRYQLEVMKLNQRHRQPTTTGALQDYEFGTQLGKGAFGEVFMATRWGEPYAIKVLKQSALKKSFAPRRGVTPALDLVKREIATMKKIAHPNCVHMFDVILDESIGRERFCLVLEYVDGGTSQASSPTDGKPIPLMAQTIWSHTRHLVLGLEYLHMHGIVHRDIKPDNLLLTRWGTLKIADFGTSCLCEGDANAQKTAGTPTFFSPELCSFGSKGSFDNRVVDLWAVGVTLYL